MLCKNCKYKQVIANTKETGMALCTHNTSYFPIHEDDTCHFLPPKKELTCKDCKNFYDDMGCAGMNENDSIYRNEKMCHGFIDRREDDFTEIIRFWQTHGLYDRKKIENLLNQIEAFYHDIKGQERETI